MSIDNFSENELPVVLACEKAIDARLAALKNGDPGDVTFHTRLTRDAADGSVTAEITTMLVGNPVKNAAADKLIAQVRGELMGASAGITARGDDAEYIDSDAIKFPGASGLRDFGRTIQKNLNPGIDLAALGERTL